MRRDTVSKEAVYIAVGIREDGLIEVLAYTIASTESAYNWQERSVEEDVLLFISDGLKGMADAVFKVFPKAKYQVCLVHVGRNITHKVRVEDRQEICEDFKTIRRATDAEAAEKELETFGYKWGELHKKSRNHCLKPPFL